MRPPEPCLVLDGSARVGVRVGVLRDGRWSGEGVAAEVALEATFACAETALRHAGLTLADIRSFVVCVGPGSILGIRVAALAARAWATLEPRPIFVWESLAAVGHAAACDPTLALGRLGASGRVVRAADGPGLENQWAAMSRGFESHTLRNEEGGPRRGPPSSL